MECPNAQTLIDGYFDAELDLLRNLEIEDHMRNCAACSRSYRGHQALRDTVRSNAVYFRTPAKLRQRIQESFHQAAGASSTSWHRTRVAAPLAAAALVVLLLAPVFREPSPQSIVPREVVSSHIRSLMANHLADVPSSDEHTVKPWFNGKLDFSPPVEDLASRGFPLVGGRLDYLNNRPVAAVVYRRNKHFINVFLWPSDKATPQDAAPLTFQGYHVFHWERAGMVYWAVSDLEQSELEKFVVLMQDTRRI